MEDVISPTLLCFCLYPIISGVMVIYQVVRWLLEGLPLEYYLTGFLHGGVVLGICAGIYLCLSLLKKGVDHQTGKLQTEKFEKFKIECLIAYGGMTIGGIVPKILVLSDPPGLYMKYYGLVIYPSFCILLIYFFLKDLNVRYKLYLQNHTKLMSVLVFLHCLSVIYTIQLNRYIFLDQETQEPVNIVHFVFTFFVGISSVELITVLTGGVRDSLAPDVPIQKRTIRRNAPIAQPVENDPRIECKICLLEYNDSTRAPRILKECGHTVCHECAQNLLRKFNNIHLFCPYCQQMSVIKGPATVLAKNFLVTDFMWKLKNNTS